MLQEIPSFLRLLFRLLFRGEGLTGVGLQEEGAELAEERTVAELVGGLSASSEADESGDAVGEGDVGDEEDVVGAADGLQEMG